MTTEDPTIKAARIDADGTYLGIDELPQSRLTELHLPHITACDLPVGEYRWDALKGAFRPIPKPKQPLKEPDTMYAVAMGFLAVRDAGIALPQATLDWLAWYQTTVDFKGKA